MKLLHCRNCNDIIKLHYGPRQCACGLTSGYYTDAHNAVYGGSFAVPLGIDNISFVQAIKNGQKLEPVFFDAFLIEENCPTFLDAERYEALRAAVSPPIKLTTTTAKKEPQGSGSG